jgi:release factor glutamine methyltransferase
MSISISEALRRGAAVLDQNGIGDARREAGALLSHVIAKDRTFLISHADDVIGASEQERFAAAIERRAGGEPAQYITGTQDFYGRAFRVTPAVLIPRPETELLVEAALQVINAEARICDVGTGSGCVAITVVCERDDARAVALDVSEAALEVARENAVSHGVSGRVQFVLSDCFSALSALHESAAPQLFDLIVSNPPYVAAHMLPGLQREVRDHEPQLALSPGEDGLSVIRRLLEESPNYLRSGGHLIMEIGFDQGEAVRHLVDENVWNFQDILPDLQCIPRIVVVQKK